MGVQQRRRTPNLYRPGSVFFTAGMLLVFTFGMALAGASEAYFNQDWVWFDLFIGGAAGCTGLYLWIVVSWLRWMGPSAEYDTEESLPQCDPERDRG